MTIMNNIETCKLTLLLSIYTYYVCLIKLDIYMFEACIIIHGYVCTRVCVVYTYARTYLLDGYMIVLINM